MIEMISPKYFYLFLVFTISCISCVDSTNLSPTESSIPIGNQTSSIVLETKEADQEKAVRLAEEFIKINGYTDSPANRDKITHESIEWESSLDELLETRKNTLESKAYGVLDDAKGAKGWTVVFICKGCDPSKTENGRAVTMNQKFENLRLEHKEIILKYVKTKLSSSPR